MCVYMYSLYCLTEDPLNLINYIIIITTIRQLLTIGCVLRLCKKRKVGDTWRVHEVAQIPEMNPTME